MLENSKVAMEKPTPIENEVSDETGQYDARFMLWRKFCDEHGIPVASLPSQLSSELKREWEELKHAVSQRRPASQ